MQLQLLQFAEEKVQLGQQANDLLQMHNEELERVSQVFLWWILCVKAVCEGFAFEGVGSRPTTCCSCATRSSSG